MANGFFLFGEYVQTPGGKFKLKVDKDLNGAAKAVLFKKDKVLCVSPAMFDLLHTDFDEVIKSLEVVDAEKFVKRELKKEKVHAGK